MKPGRYKLEVVLKDTRSGNASVIERLLAVPAYEAARLSTSSVILADRIRTAGPAETRPDPFVVEGGLKLYPRPGSRFEAGESMTAYLEIYGMGIDAARGMPDVDIDCEILKDGAKIGLPDGAVIRASSRFFGDRIALYFLFSLRKITPGEYTMRFILKDKVSAQTISPQTSFSVAALAVAESRAR